MRKSNILFLTVLALVVSGALNGVVCQNKDSNTQPVAGFKTPEPSSKVATLKPEFRTNPVLLVPVNGGPAVPADLIGAHPEDADAILVKIRGESRTIKIDEVTIIQQSRKFDEFAYVASNDMKARLDNFAIGIQSSEDSAYIIGYGSCGDQARSMLLRAQDYLVNQRGLNREKVRTIDGGCRSISFMELWVAPPGAGPPTASRERVIAPCPKCGTVTPKPKPKPKAKSKRKRSNRR